MKLTRRRLLVASVVAVVVSGGAWFTFSERSQPPFGVNRAAYRAIRMGMTIEDVEHIIGRPADRWGTLPLSYTRYDREIDESLCLPHHDIADAILARIGEDLAWWGDGVVIIVSTNRDGVVYEKQVASNRLLDRLLRQVQSFWRKLGF